MAGMKRRLGLYIWGAAVFLIAGWVAFVCARLIWEIEAHPLPPIVQVPR